MYGKGTVASPVSREIQRQGLTKHREFIDKIGKTDSASWSNYNIL